MANKSNNKRAIEIKQDVTNVTDGGTVIGVNHEEHHHYHAQSTPEKPRLSHEPETVLIPAGTFLMGSAEEDSPYTIDLPIFRMGIYPITNDQYTQFLWKTGRVANKEMLWDGNKPSADRLRHPVMGVTWYDAMDYCRWLCEETGRDYTLPSEAQWEKGARGTDGRFYPWGNDWEPDRCNRELDTVTAVSTYPPQTPYGCYDMVGNLREWTTTLWGNSPQQPDPRYHPPWQADSRDDLTAPATTRRIFRGGHGNTADHYRCRQRSSYLPDRPGPRRQRHGFRVIQKVKEEQT